MAGASLALADLNGLFAAFNEQYLTDPSFAWLMRPSTWAKVCALDTTATSALTMPRMNVAGYNFVGNLYGLPVCLSSNMPAATSNLFPIIGGAWKSGFILAERGPRTLTVDTMTAPGLRKYYMRSRFGSAVLANTALKCLKWATS
jgi:HK97 family phage major capsid protein